MTGPRVTPEAGRNVLDAIYLALLDAGVRPEVEVARFERMLSTFVIGYVVSETGGRFLLDARHPRARRAQLPGTESPPHRELASYSTPPRSWDTEFDADLDNLVRLVETAARP